MVREGEEEGGGGVAGVDVVAALHAAADISGNRIESLYILYAF